MKIFILILLIFVISCPIFALYTITHTTKNITTASSTVLALNSRRKYLSITNLGTKPIYLAFGTTANANWGLPLAPSGNIQMYGLTLWTGTVTGIAKTDNQLIAILEGK